jgi:carboxyl-terminal processing protease
VLRRKEKSLLKGEEKKKDLDIPSFFIGVLYGFMVLLIMFSVLSPIPKTLIRHLVFNHFSSEKDVIQEATDKFQEAASLVAYLNPQKVTEKDFLNSINLGMKYFDRFNGYASDYLDVDRKGGSDTFLSFGSRLFDSDQGFQVEEVAEGGPWFEKGVKVGDVLIRVDTKRIDTKEKDSDFDMSIAFLLSTISEEGVGVPSNFTFKRGEDTFEITSTPEYFIMPLAVDYGVSKGVAHVVLRSFKQGADVQVRSLIDAKIKEADAAGTPLKGLVLDLRNNGGGYVSIARNILDDFLPEGKVAYSIEGQNVINQTVRAKGVSRWPDLKIVTLVNGGTASASELLVGSLKENDKAEVLGWETLGKGSVQLAEKSFFSGTWYFTTAEYKVGYDVSVRENGVFPDVLGEGKDLLRGPRRYEEDPLLVQAYSVFSKMKS